MRYIKTFENHSQYEDFIQSKDYLNPNISHCVSENEVHYNRYFLTPKQFVEYRYSFLKSICDKFYTHRKQYMDFKTEYENICANKLARLLTENLNLYDKGLRYGMSDLSTYSYTDASFTNSDNRIIDLGVSNNLIVGLRIDNNSHYLIGDASLYKTDEIYNGNDVFYIPWIDTYEHDYEDEEDAVSAIIEETRYGDNVVLLCPHDTYANFTIAYPDGNGGYTTTKPSSLTWTLTITDGTIRPNTEWFTLTLFHMEDQSINTRVDNVVTTMRSDFKKWYNADFSDLSVLDDIKLEFPKDIYDFIVNPWKYLNENIIFSYYEYVDLGLPSGTLWAMTNVGTIYDTNYGLYFQWGDTKGYTAEQVGTDKQFSWEDYKFNPDGDGSTMTKYNTTDGKTVLDPEDDAARVNWGSCWKMPTVKQCEELLNTKYVTNEYVTNYHDSGVNGLLFTSVSNGNTMFIPAAGDGTGDKIYNVGNRGCIWASALNSQNVKYAWYFYFYNDGSENVNNYTDRSSGYSVRAVINQ